MDIYKNENGKWFDKVTNKDISDTVCIYPYGAIIDLPNDNDIATMTWDIFEKELK